MGKFNAAKMSGSGDVAFQNNYNYLIDLLDNGYLAEGIVGGKRVRVDVNPRDGFKMNIDNTDVFYIDSSGDAVFTGKVTIGSNSEFEEGYNPITLSDDAKDALAQNMGYDDYADMVAEATAGNTIIDGGYINAILIKAHSIVADMFAVGAVDVGARNLALGTEFAEWIAYTNADVSHSDETLTNLVSNGNFVDATGWTAMSGTGAVANNTYVHTCDGSRFYPYLGGVLPLSVIGHVYATTVRFRVTTTDCLRLVWQHGNGLSLNQPEQVTSPVQNMWYQKTFVYTATNATTSVEIAHIYADAATANGKVMEVQYVSCVDLTTDFGAGNEPTQTEYEKWIAKQPNGWFDDTAKVHGLGGARTNIVKATANDSQTSQFGIQQATTFRTIKLIEGETYTLSFLVRGNVPAINYVYIMNMGADNQSVEMNSEVTSATAFSRVSKTFVADANSGASTSSHLMISFAGTFTTASWFQIQEVKLEKGNVVTDWCPAATETSAFNVATNTRYRIDNERAGYYDATTDAFIGGSAVVGTKVASISQIIAGTADPTVWGQIGAITGGGLGLELVHKTGGVFFIAARLDDGGFTLLDHSEVNRFYAGATSTRLYDAAGVGRFYAGATSTQLFDSAGTSRFYAGATLTQLYDADGYARLTLDGTVNYSTFRAKNGASYNEIGVDATGAYKIKAGKKTYL